LNASRFDDISRRIALAGGRIGSRRGILRAGVGVSLATTLGVPEFCAAAPTTGAPASRTLTRQVSPEHLLVQQIAFDLDYDLDKIFRFVADEIAYESYVGALRGVRGTIWSGAGNSVDQAQLLAALLTEARVDVRYAMGTLPDENADALLEAMAAPRVVSETLENARSINRAAATEQKTPTASATPVPDQPAGAEVAERVAALREQLFEEAIQSLAEGVAEVTDALTSAGVAVPTNAPALAVMEGERHVWVQIRQGAEWVDLDPSFAENDAGSTPATFAESMAELPVDLFHLLAFRVVAETASGESLAEQVVLDYTVKSQDLVGEDVLIMHIEPESLEAIGSGISAVLGGQISYYPLIVLGQEGYLADTTITFGSDGGVLGDDVLGGGGGVQEGNCLAERYEITVTSPGAKPVTVSRMLFDRVPTAQRLSGTLVLADIPPVQEVELGNGERGVLEVKGVVAMASVVSAIDADYLARPVPDDAPVSAYTGAIHAMYGLQDALALRQNGELGFYFDRPNIAAYVTSPRPVADGGNPGIMIEADLLAQGYGLRTAPTAVPAGIFAGVLAQEAERLALNPTLFRELFDLGALPVQPELTRVDIREVFKTATGSGVEILVVTEANAADLLGAVGLPSDVEARIEAQLRAGLVIITPAEMTELGGSPTTAWWTFDPVTGALFDQMADGRGGAMVVLGPMGEYAVKLWAFTKTLKGFLLLGACIYSIMQAVGGVLNFNPNSTIGDFVSTEGAAGAAVVACAGYGAAGAV